jgi:hypothetical protein
MNHPPGEPGRDKGSERPTDDGRWQAVTGRDAGCDGKFVYAVTSTGIYCDPSCPSRKPRRDRVRYFGTPLEAEAEGFRACKRCRPDSNDPTRSYDFAAGRRDPGYSPPLGFVERVGVRFVEGGVAHGWFRGRGPLQEQVLGVRTTLISPGSLADPETLAGTVHWEGRRRGGGSGSISFTVRHEALDEAFLLSPEATVPQGEYTYPEASARVAAPPGWRVRGGMNLTVGKYFDGHRLSVALRPLVTFSRYLEVSGSLERNRVVFPTRDERFEGDVIGLRVRASLNPSLSIHSLAQYNGATGRVVGNLRLRQSFGEGRDLYLVWNEGRRTAPGPEDGSGGPEFRGLSIKYSHLVGW